MKQEGARRKRFPFGGEGGFSMTELIIALAIAVVAAAGLYSVYISQNKESSSQRLHNDLQNNLRFAMDVMKNELFLAGYKAIDAAQPIKAATPQTITFEYWDDNLAADGIYTQNVAVTYSLSGTDLVRSVEYYHNANGFDGSKQEDQVIAEHVTALVFSYRKSDNKAYTDDNLTTPAELEDVRNIKISLSGRSRKPDPLLKDPGTGAEYYRTLTLTGEVKSRNLNIAANPFDETAPSTPTGLNVWDPGFCGRLNLRWDANVEPDLAGYTILYGLTSGSYAGRVQINRGPGTGDNPPPENYTLAGLETPYEPYYVTIRAFDRSANNSALAAPVHNEASPDVRGPGGQNDTSIDPDVPLPPADLAATFPEDGKVLVSWTPSSEASVVGYRLFRDRYDYHTESYNTSDTPIALENELTREKAEWLDSGTAEKALVGCWKYRYRIASIHCDPGAFPDQYAEGDYAVLEDVEPTDSVAPSPPGISARAGYQRFFLTLTNPLRDADPDFEYTKIFYNKGDSGSGNFPAVDTNGDLVEGSGFLLPDGDPQGTFRVEGQKVIDFNDEHYPPSPSVPLLDIDETYFFLAVAYDRCGNSSGNTAQASGTQCGDGEGTAYDGAPPAPDPMSFNTEGCGYHIAMEWEDMWNTRDQESILDFAGYHVYRREAFSDGSVGEWVDQNEVGPSWDPGLQNSRESEFPVELGKAYNYKVCATDCFYERGRLSPETIPDGGVWEDNISCVEAKSLRDFYIGEFSLSDGQKIVQTGDLEISTGGPTIPEDPPTTTGSEFYLNSTLQHNTATVDLDNKAVGTLTETAVTMSWDDPLETFLTTIVIGDSSTTSQEWVYYQPGAPVSSNSIATYNPSKAIDGSDIDVPHRFVFTGADGNDYADVLPDLREGFLDVKDLAWTNDSTEDSSCTQGERLWGPLGPIVSGAVQDRPDDPTVSWSVPGEGGNNQMDRVVVPGDASVHVRANVIPDLFTQGLIPFDVLTPLASPVRLFYYVDIGAVLPDPPRSYEFTNSIPMMQEVGNQWRTQWAIPASNDSNVWYYLFAVDVNGNFDREPEVYAGAFQYYQQAGDICANTPGPPTGLMGTASTSSIQLEWDAPLFNDEETNPTTFTDPGGYNVYRNDGQGWSRIPAASGDPDDPTVDAYTRTYYDYIEPPDDLATADFSYYVTAVDTCRPEPNEGTRSTIFTECLGAPPCVFSVLTSGDGNTIVPGETFTIDLTVCAKQDGTDGETIFAQVCSENGVLPDGGGIGDADPIELKEEGDSGHFTIDAGVYGRDYVQTYVTLDYPTPTSAALDVDLVVDEAGDTVTVGAWSQTGYSGSTCANGAFTCGEYNFSVLVDPCLTDPVVPGPPTGLVVETPDCCDVGPDCDSKPKAVVLSWEAAGGTVTGYRVEYCGDGTRCDTNDPGDWSRQPVINDTTSSFSVDSRMDNSTWLFRVVAINDPRDVCSDQSSVETISDPVTEMCD